MRRLTWLLLVLAACRAPRDVDPTDPSLAGPPEHSVGYGGGVGRPPIELSSISPRFRWIPAEGLSDVGVVELVDFTFRLQPNDQAARIWFDFVAREDRQAKVPIRPLADQYRPEERTYKDRRGATVPGDGQERDATASTKGAAYRMTIDYWVLSNEGQLELRRDIETGFVPIGCFENPPADVEPCDASAIEPRIEQVEIGGPRDPFGSEALPVGGYSIATADAAPPELSSVSPRFYWNHSELVVGLDELEVELADTDGLQKIEFWVGLVGSATSDVPDDALYVDFAETGWKGDDSATVSDSSLVLPIVPEAAGLAWKVRVTYESHETKTRKRADRQGFEGR